MLNTADILETINMIREENLDIRTITMGISLLDCIGQDSSIASEKVYDKVTRLAEKLVPVGEQLERELGIPIINKRISVTPISIVVLLAVIMLSLQKLLTGQRIQQVLISSVDIQRLFRKAIQKANMTL